MFDGAGFVLFSILAVFAVGYAMVWLVAVLPWP